MSLVDRLRHWAARHTRRNVYSPVGQAFHWIITALVFFQLWWGWWVGRLPVGSDKFEGYQLHSQVGVAILVLLLLRLMWRSIIPGPVNDADEPGWQSTAARLTHYVFYFLLVALPLSGWAMWSSMASEQPLTLAGVAPWPQLPLHDLPLEMRWAIMQWSEAVHFWSIWALLVTILIHAGAAMKHHFIDRDDVLAGMVPFLRPLRSRPATGLHEPPDLQSHDPSNVG